MYARGRCHGRSSLSHSGSSCCWRQTDWVTSWPVSQSTSRRSLPTDETHIADRAQQTLSLGLPFCTHLARCRTTSRISPLPSSFADLIHHPENNRNISIRPRRACSVLCRSTSAICPSVCLSVRLTRLVLTVELWWGSWGLGEKKNNGKNRSTVPLAHSTVAQCIA